MFFNKFNKFKYEHQVKIKKMIMAEFKLSKREADVAFMVANLLVNNDSNIAEKLKVTVNTVKQHKANIGRKLDAYQVFAPMTSVQQCITIVNDTAYQLLTERKEELND